MFFAACSVGWIVGRIESSMCSITADVSGTPTMRNARAKARRRIASLTHCGTGCSHAPRPGSVPAGSTITAYSPFPTDTATTRSSSTANSRFRHPTHVRTGPSVCLCVKAEGSRWITAKSSVTQPVVRTTRTCTRCESQRLPGDQRNSIAEFDAPVGTSDRHGGPIDGRVVLGRALVGGLVHGADDREPVQVEAPAGARHDQLVTLLRPQAPAGAGEERHAGVRLAEAERARRAVVGEPGQRR